MRQISKSILKTLILQLFILGGMIFLYLVNEKADCKIGGRTFVLLALILKGAVVIPSTIFLLVLTTRRSLKFSQIEAISVVIAIPSGGWFLFVISKFIDGNNDCRHEAILLWLILLTMFVEAICFFVKLAIIVVGLICSVTVHYIQTTYGEWRQKSESKKAYDAILKQEKWKLDRSQAE